MPELAADLASGHNIVATVYAECHSMYRKDGVKALRSLGETEFVRGQAAMSASGEFGSARACDVMFGNVDLTQGGAVESLLEQHLEASGGRFRGVRLSSGWHPDDKVGNVAAQAHLLIDPRVREAIAVLSRLGMSLDCWLYHPQLDEVAQIADAYPDLTIILNHVGTPILGGPYRGKADEVFKEWKASIGDVSQRDNVFMKLACRAILGTAVYHPVQRRWLRPGGRGWKPVLRRLVLRDPCMNQIFRCKNAGVAIKFAGMLSNGFLPAHRPLKRQTCLRVPRQGPIVSSRLRRIVEWPFLSR
jgi:predicted TIM-barrel fold metal-dependent hydrolase